VVQVIDEADGEVVYTIRIKGNAFRPKVFREGRYTVKVGDQEGKMKEIKGIEALPPDVDKDLRLDF